MTRRCKLVLAILAVVIAAAAALSLNAWRVARIRRQVERLAAGLLSEDEAAVRAAVRDLSAMKSRTAARHLLAIYVREGPPDMDGPIFVDSFPHIWRMSSAWEVKRFDRVLPAVFARMGEPAVRPLLDALTQNDPWIERLQRTLKSRFGGPNLEFADKNGDLIGLAETSLGRIGAPAASGLIRILDDAANPDIVRRAAALALRKSRAPEALEPLARAVQSGREYAAGTAGFALGAFGKEGLNELVVLLESKDLQVRRDAASGVAFSKAPGASDALLGILAYETDPELFGLAMYGLEFKKDTAALEGLLDHGSEKVRRAALMTLGRLGDARALDLCLGLAQDPIGQDNRYPVMVQLNAVEVLGSIGDPAATPVLIGLLSNEDLYLAGHAAAALATIGGNAAIEALLQEANTSAGDGSGERLERLLRALERTGRPEARALVDRLLAQSAYVMDPAVAEIIESNGLEAFKTNWRQYLFRKWAEKHAGLFSLALERHGTVEMARGYLECYPWPHLGNIAREWAERHARIDELEDLLEK